ncbi:hypothetical protein [Leptolyngbya sp. FACHB-17]|uniref:hypothetical protein n=1 Tax=unclassified Leptolyngbya TaxID=2650499 RepID=UPI001680457E|nr:hypothetical protein [Leptolyngbya sp. FACHB-17]MBD2078353.1 hypothetical protein [Leptolyngbya sp. FACHB-17]
MPRKDMKSALTSSLKAEDAAVRDRFERAESLLSDLRTEEPVVPPTPAPIVEKVEEKEQPKVKRDSFTIPVSDYEIIDTIRKRCLACALNVNKSEVIRAGLHALQNMTNTELIAMMESLEKVKTGRPANKV